jgi:hypothetical protein
MELDELKEKWAQVEASTRLNHRILDAMQRTQAKSRLQRLRVLTAVHAVAWIVCTEALGSYVYAHLDTARFALPGAAVGLYALGLVMTLFRQLVLIARVDYAEPVTVIQRRLEAIRIWRSRTTQWAVLAGTVLWAPCLFIVVHALTGVDVYRVFGMRWLAANVVFGMALIPLTLWALGRFPAVKRLRDDLGGTTLKEAAAFLATLAEFEAVGER